jgi:two-component system cell cycle response regulator DivK
MKITTPSPGRILVAEDDELIMRMVTAVIESEGYTMVAARDGREAYRILLTDANFAAAIFDINMPHLKGLDLIGHMQTEGRLRRIPVMLMTAEQDLKLYSASLAAGALLFLRKPFSATQMQTMLRLLVGNAALSRKKRPAAHSLLARAA